MQKILEILKYIIIGFIQGITEILPISSSGHLALTFDLLNIQTINQLDLTIYLHLASSLALIIFFFKSLKQIIKNSFQFIFKKKIEFKKDFLTIIFLIIASIPAAIFGFIFKPIIEIFFDNGIYVALGFLITSLILFLSSKITNNNQSNYSLKNTLITGFFQSFSIFPGISRSGTTLFGSKIAKLNEQKGKEFTFLLLLPISIGSAFLSIFENDFQKQFYENTIYLYIVAMIVAFIFTLISLKYFFKINLEKKYKYYSLYLFLLGLFSMIYYL